MAVFSSAVLNGILKSPQSLLRATAPLGSPRGAFFVAVQSVKPPLCVKGEVPNASEAEGM